MAAIELLKMGRGSMASDVELTDFGLGERDMSTTTPPDRSGPAQLAEQWARIRGRLQQEVGDVEYRTWLRQMTLAGLEGDEIALHLPTRFLRDWVREHYADRLSSLWRSENPAVRFVDIRVGGGAPAMSGLAESLGPNGAAPTSLYTSGLGLNGMGTNGVGTNGSGTHGSGTHGSGTHGGGGHGLSSNAAGGTARGMSRADGEVKGEPRPDTISNLDPRFTFDAFVVGKPNEFAHACARRVAEQPASPGFNPLFLYGGVGLGKTHLMHAIAWDMITRGGGTSGAGSNNGNGSPNGTGSSFGQPISVAYMSAERFMYRFIAAIRSQATMEFKDQLRSVDVLMIDDLQFLIGKDNTQEEFFHTFNALVEAGKQIVVSADVSPSDLEGLEARLRTRLSHGMVADLHSTTYELRLSILEAKAARAGVAVPPKVLEFLAHKITSNVRELEGALNRLVAHANLFNRQVTLETTHEVLHDILKAHDRRLTIEEIQRKVAEHYNIRLTDMSSARRARAVARPRQVAMWLAKQLTQRSLPEIGRKFGNRDHTTVMHAVSRIHELMARDAAFAEDVELLRRMLQS
jgi:chromosomal replication initiator protein